MNERIKLLVEQAGLKHHNWITNESNVTDGDFKYPRLEDYEKFTELIVRECSNAVLSVPCYHKDYRSQIEEAVINDCARTVLERFGVKE